METLSRILGIGREQVNTGRQPELDLVKLIALMIMPVVHCLDWYSIFYGDASPICENTINFLNRVFCAPVFMCAMGAGIAFSRRGSVRDVIDRGITLLLSGWLLNMVRILIESDLLALLSGETYLLIENSRVIGVDILEYSACACFLTALLRKLKLNEQGILLTAVVLSFAGQLLIRVETGNYLIDSLLGYFWGTDTESYFPLFHWYIYTAGGLVFGTALRRVSDKKKFYKLLIAAGTAAFLFLLIVNLCLIPGEQNYFDAETNYTWVSPINSIPLVFIFVGYCGIVYLLTGGRDLPWVRKTSANITGIYGIHWLILSILCLLACLKVFSWPESELLTVLIGLLVFLLAALLAEKYRTSLKPAVNAWIADRRTAVRVAIAVAAIAMTITGIAIHDRYFPDSPYSTFLNEYDIEPKEKNDA